MNPLRTLIAAVLLGCSATAFGQDESQTDAQDSRFTFRNHPWGTSVEEVRESESSAPVSQEKDYLLYRVKLLGADFRAAYVFHKGHLYMGKYLLDSRYEDLNAYIQIYRDLKNSLADKYGKPKEDRQVWNNSRLEFEKERWGEAVRNGDTMYYALWELGENEITIHLRGVNGNIYLQIQYRDMTVVNAKTAKEMDVL